MENNIISVETIERPELNSVETLYTFSNGYGVVAATEKGTNKWIVGILRNGVLIKNINGKNMIFRNYDWSDVEDLVQVARVFTRQFGESK